MFNNVKAKKEVSAEGCPSCSGHLVLRHGKYGPFYGCSNYPNCTYSQPTEEEQNRRLERVLRSQRYFPRDPDEDYEMAGIYGMSSVSAGWDT